MKDSSTLSENQERCADSKIAGHFRAPENTAVANPGVELLHRKTQSAALLRLLIAARGAWVPLPEILALGIAQYGARVHELRRLGFNIENRTERVTGTRQRHSWFRLLNSPAQGV